MQVDDWKAEYDKILAERFDDDKQALHRISLLWERHPNVREIALLRASILVQNGKVQQGIDAYEAMPQPDAEVLSRIGMLFHREKNLPKALDYLQRAVKIEPQNVEILINYGFLLQNNQQLSAACQCFENILKIDPKHSDVLFRLAWLEAHRGNFERALALYQQIPNHVSAQSSAVFYRHYLMPNQPEQITLAAQKLGKIYSARNPIKQKIQAALPEKPLTIGLVSADLNGHVVGFFIESLLSGKATQQYKWFAYYNHHTEDDVSQYLKGRMTGWHNIHQWKDERVVQQIRDDGVDVLIDLSGYTGGSRLDVFAAQAAPVQAAWLGYFGTTGLPEMQAIIADPYCVPQNEAYLYTEKVYRMPHTRLCMTAPSETKVGSVITGKLGGGVPSVNLSLRPKLPLPIAPTPALEKGHITFGCYQNLLKINDVVLQTWAEIARRLPEARWHFQNGRLGEKSEDLAIFKQKLRHHGFDLDKISFSGNLSRQNYLLHYNQVDIVLDTFPYNGGTTTAEALWMATPTITWAMAGMIARQGEQMMCAAGYPEWVCRSQAEYVDKAVFWGQPENFQELNDLHMKMREKVAQSPLFDTEQFAADWCALIRQMWRDFCVGKPNVSLQIESKPMLVVRRKKAE